MDGWIDGYMDGWIDGFLQCECMLSHTIRPHTMKKIVSWC